MLTVPAGDPLAVAATEAVQKGDLVTLRQLLAENPGLVNARIGNGMSRTLLHTATDWPGHFPNCVAIVTTLVEAGANVNARFSGPHTETPLHWAASSDDVDVLDTLIDLGADIEAAGGVIGDGTPLADAVAFGQWKAARRLIERGARTDMWQAAALGLMPALETYFVGAVLPSQDDITNAFWSACHGGQRGTAEFLLDRGADLNWVGYDELSPLDAALREGHEELAVWLRGRGAKSAS